MRCVTLLWMVLPRRRPCFVFGKDSIVVSLLLATPKISWVLGRGLWRKPSVPLESPSPSSNQRTGFAPLGWSLLEFPSFSRSGSPPCQCILVRTSTRMERFKVMSNSPSTLRCTRGHVRVIDAKARRNPSVNCPPTRRKCSASTEAERFSAREYLCRLLCVLREENEVVPHCAHSLVHYQQEKVREAPVVYVSHKTHPLLGGSWRGFDGSWGSWRKPTTRLLLVLSPSSLCAPGSTHAVGIHPSNVAQKKQQTIMGRRTVAEMSRRMDVRPLEARCLPGEGHRGRPLAPSRSPNCILH